MGAPKMPMDDRDTFARKDRRYEHPMALRAGLGAYLVAAISTFADEGMWTFPLSWRELDPGTRRNLAPALLQCGNSLARHAPARGICMGVSA